MHNISMEIHVLRSVYEICARAHLVSIFPSNVSSLPYIAISYVCFTTWIYILRRKRNATSYILVFFYIANVRIFLKVYFMTLHNE